jgi:hypothetical protein
VREMSKNVRWRMVTCYYWYVKCFECGKPIRYGERVKSGMAHGKRRRIHLACAAKEETKW